eukprot:TRINITY_DN91547_c0_g1_i1.p1 TRINITY_DN91547_c0_g1~~TRINITY_DN91547_c0_g1_i1.p1  ORF type:complete len:258 (-),score=31.16 TRINITY_DN91547_c0_g1_i1:8-781(-)
MELTNLNEPLQDVDARSCAQCGKRVSLVASAMPCRCNRIFCDAHRYCEDHDCPALQEALASREREARDVQLRAPSTPAAQLSSSSSSMSIADFKRDFDAAHDMPARVAHACSFLVWGIALLNAALSMFSFSLSGCRSAFFWTLAGLLFATLTVKLGPRLGSNGHRATCSNCSYSLQTWCSAARPSWRVIRDVEYESVMEVIIYYCSYRKTNCLTDTLYGGPRELGFILRTVFAKVASLQSSGNGSNIFSGCQTAGAR